MTVNFTLKATCMPAVRSQARPCGCTAAIAPPKVPKQAKSCCACQHPIVRGAAARDNLNKSIWEKHESHLWEDVRTEKAGRSGSAKHAMRVAFNQNMHVNHPMWSTPGQQACLTGRHDVKVGVKPKTETHLSIQMLAPKTRKTTCMRLTSSNPLLTASSAYIG